MGLLVVDGAALALERPLVDAGRAVRNVRQHHHSATVRARRSFDGFRWRWTKFGLRHGGFETKSVNAKERLAIKRRQDRYRITHFALIVVAGEPSITRNMTLDFSEPHRHLAAVGDVTIVNDAHCEFEQNSSLPPL